MESHLQLLAEELHRSSSLEARRWEANLQPLTSALSQRYLDFFPKQTYAIRTGRLIPLLSPQDAAVHPDLPAAQRMPSNRIVGGPESVLAQLTELVHKTAANEIMVSTVTYSIADRLRSLELLAQVWPLL